MQFYFLKETLKNSLNLKDNLKLIEPPSCQNTYPNFFRNLETYVISNIFKIFV
jgi:hypothetical protein